MTKKENHGLDPALVADHALVVGDPQRATEAALLLRDSHLILNNREYKVFSGSFKGKNITICSHGVGASGAAYIFELLFNAGVKTIIRAGTCGAMVRGIPDGGIIIGTGAIRSDGLTRNMVPEEFPAISDRRIVQMLEQVCSEFGFKDTCVGIVLTDGLYFPYDFVESRMDTWQKLGAVAIEMEFAPLLIQASIHGARAGGLFVSDGNVVEEPDPWKVNSDKDEIHKGKQTMIQIALEALARLE